MQVSSGFSRLVPCVSDPVRGLVFLSGKIAGSSTIFIDPQQRRCRGDVAAVTSWAPTRSCILAGVRSGGGDGRPRDLQCVHSVGWMGGHREGPWVAESCVFLLARVRARGAGGVLDFVHTWVHTYVLYVHRQM